MKEVFRKIANKISYATGTAAAFLLALTVIITWAVTGPAFGYSNTWQLVINTGTTIVTFLMVFLIQNTQNRDGKAMQLKLDELIRATKARDAFVDLEDLTDEELAALDSEFRELHDKQVGSHLMKKLHTKIEAEHKRRSTIRGQAEHVMNMFNPNSKN
jgi:low affinity Fe/Cu permease